MHYAFMEDGFKQILNQDLFSFNFLFSVFGCFKLFMCWDLNTSCLFKARQRWLTDGRNLSLIHKLWTIKNKILLIYFKIGSGILNADQRTIDLIKYDKSESRHPCKRHFNCTSLVSLLNILSNRRNSGLTGCSHVAYISLWVLSWWMKLEVVVVVSLIFELQTLQTTVLFSTVSSPPQYLNPNGIFLPSTSSMTAAHILVCRKLLVY